MANSVDTDEMVNYEPQGRCSHMAIFSNSFYKIYVERKSLILIQSWSNENHMWTYRDSVHPYV